MYIDINQHLRIQFIVYTQKKTTQNLQHGMLEKMFLYVSVGSPTDSQKRHSPGGPGNLMKHYHFIEPDTLPNKTHKKHPSPSPLSLRTL